jgi:ribulose-phosphate 3-epimerase
MKNLIAPSLLSADFGKLAIEIRAIEQAGADWLHIDVMDGSFVPPISFGTNMLELCRSESGLFRDVHLMIENPAKHFGRFIAAGAQNLTFHLEASSSPSDDLQSIRSLGAEAGISLRPETPIEMLFPHLEQADLVLVMTVSPGYGGQSFLPKSEERIQRLADERKRRSLNFHIEVDGGINPTTAALSAKHGANVFVAGSAVFSKTDRQAAIKEIRDSFFS